MNSMSIGKFQKNIDTKKTNVIYYSFGRCPSMSEIDKWYAWYPNDYRRSARWLSDDEDLLYRRMLDLYWEEGGNLQESSLKVIAKMCGTNWRKFKRCWPQVSNKFPIDNGKLTNPRMDMELKKAEQKHRDAVEKGRKGGRPKKSPSFSPAFENGKPRKSPAGGDGPIQRDDLPIYSNVRGSSDESENPFDQTGEDASWS